ncbi:expressed unknown protein [Seminavis robusta]|uniref:Uncharacterized protein n=1 Tax=Seminavis robusta TaxID=568900 RepID=A0A9N8DZ18_9STRA|nr:expressed unknown protein [Seminavis robusta]|eukprot:Sro489_g153310.1 n/a (1036) ;mRNA; r:40433-43818
MNEAIQDTNQARQARYLHYVDPGCSGPPPTVELVCDGEIQVTQVSDPSIVCTPNVDGTSVTCVTICDETSNCDQSYVYLESSSIEGPDAQFAEIQFDCRGDVLGDIEASLTFLGGSAGSCDSADDVNVHVAQLGIDCGSGSTSSFSFDDKDFECGLGNAVDKLEDRYSCKTANTPICSSSTSTDCLVEFDDLFLASDHVNFDYQACVQAFNGATFPADDTRTTTIETQQPGKFSAVFEAKWQLALDTTVCGGDYTGRRLSCLNGNITLVETLQDTVSCSSVSDNILECEDTAATHFVNGFTGVAFQCNSTNALPQAQAEYLPADSLCVAEEDMSVAHYIQLGVRCEEPGGNVVTSFDDYLFECGLTNEFDVFNNTYTCVSAAHFSAGVNQGTSRISSTTIHTDMGWAQGVSQNCYTQEEVPCALSLFGIGFGCSETAPAPPPGGGQTSGSHIPLTFAPTPPTGPGASTTPAPRPPSSGIPLTFAPTGPTPRPPASALPLTFAPTPTSAPATTPTTEAPLGDMEFVQPPPGTIYHVDYQLRFKRVLDPLCDGPEREQFAVQCESGELEVLGTSDPSIVCTPPQPRTTSTQGMFAFCEFECRSDVCKDASFVEINPPVDPLTNDWTANEEFASIEFRCSLEDDVDGVDAAAWIYGTETTLEFGTCTGDAVARGRNAAWGQLNVLCPDEKDPTVYSYSNDDHYLDCTSNFLPYDVNGNYSCVTGQFFCPDGDFCRIEYDQITFTADHHRYQECIQTNNGSPVPQPDVPFMVMRTPGTYTARFGASWAFTYDEDVCSGRYTGLRVTCPNGVIDLIESTQDCEVVADNEIECTETRLSFTSVYVYEDFVIYECTSVDETPTARAEYFPTDVSCSSNATVSRFLTPGLWCGDLGDQSFSYSDTAWECGKDNEHTLTSGAFRFTCFEARDVSSNTINAVIELPSITAETDYRWASFPSELCYRVSRSTSSNGASVAKSASVPAIDKSQGTPASAATPVMDSGQGTGGEESDPIAGLLLSRAGRLSVRKSAMVSMVLIGWALA